VFQESALRLPDFVARNISVLPLLVFVVLFVSGCGGLVSHKVESGDSLYSIGFYYGHDYRDIAEWNNIPEPYVIHKGQWLRVAPPDDKWWEEQNAQNTKNGMSAQNAPKQRNDSGNQTENQNSVASKRTHSMVSKKSHRRPKKIVVEDFTDQGGKIDAWVWPTKGRVLNADKKFSQRNKGIDISGRRGQLVFATAEGKVVYSGSGLIGYGKLIILKHNKIYLSAYAHNEKILVKEGDIVKRGQKIAHMGPTPDNHIQLHFEIRRNGKPVDPLRFLKR